MTRPPYLQSFLFDLISMHCTCILLYSISVSLPVVKALRVQLLLFVNVLHTHLTPAWNVRMLFLRQIFCSRFSWISIRCSSSSFHFVQKISLNALTADRTPKWPFFLLVPPSPPPVSHPIMPPLPIPPSSHLSILSCSVARNRRLTRGPVIRADEAPVISFP